MKTARGIWFIITLAILALVIVSVWFMQADYESVIQFAIEQLKRPDLSVQLKEKFFTAAKFETLQRANYSILAVLLAVLGFFIVKRKMIFRGLNSLIKIKKTYLFSWFNSIQKSSGTIQILLAILVLLVLIRSVYYALTFYPQYDECWNYNYFLSNNILTTFFAYNNYPLHNVVTFFFLQILPDTTFVMRLPNIILGVLNILLVFVLVKKIFKNEIIGFIACALFAVLPTAVFYMLFARGVMLALTFGLLLLYFFIAKRIETWGKIDIVLVAIFCALGSFSMISFPIYFILLFAIHFIKSLQQGNKQALRKLTYTSLWIGMFVLILFTPMAIGSGFDLGLDSNYANQSFSWSSLWRVTEKISKDQIGFFYGAYFFLIVNFVFLFLSKKKEIIILNIGLLLIPYLLFIIGIHLPARALSFQIVAYLFSLTILFEYLLRKTSIAIVSFTSLAILLYGNYISTKHTFFDWSNRPDKGAYEIAQILQAENSSSYYDIQGQYSYFVPSILYHHKINGKDIKYFTSNKKSARYLPKNKFSGNVFMANNPLSDTISSEILYHYQDESRNFTVYRQVDPPHEAL
jgi:uncharacterized membrane protein